MKFWMNIFSIVVGIAWVPLFIWDWKIAGLILLVMWSNNLMIKAQNM